MSTEPVIFIPGTGQEPLLPLARYLPPLSEGTVSGWLKARVPPGSWVIDPLNANPYAALEAARAGYRVVVVSNNPTLTFMLETLASAPKPAEFQAALAELGASLRGEEHLERHIQGLYLTTCPNCDASIPAQAYLWRRGEPAPYMRIVHCPQCGENAELPPEPGDLERLKLPGNVALHRARAVARVAAPGDDHYEAAREAANAYQDRPLYALSTLINKQEGLSLPERQRKLLVALLISACDAASSLWPHPGGRSRPRQLGTPAQFRENNVWAALEVAIPSWQGLGRSVRVVPWPELPREGEISLYAGRARGLLPLPAETRQAALLAVFPRPNQAFWALTTIWAGWLWGREASLPLHALLSRRRFDWAWHANAMQAPLAALARALPAGTPLIGLLTETAPGLLSAALTATVASRFRLEGLAAREDSETAPGYGGEAQGLWRLGAGQSRETSENEQKEAFEEGIRAMLAGRAEPARYLGVHAAGLARMMEERPEAGAPQSWGDNRRPGVEEAGRAVNSAGDFLAQVQGIAAKAFSNQLLIRRFTGGSQEEERSLWWLADNQIPKDLGEPLAERVEREAVRLLQGGEVVQRAEVASAIYGCFPEELTPPADLIQAVLESYAEEQASQPGAWRLRAADAPSRRRADLTEAHQTLVELGRRMGYSVEDQEPLTWRPVSFGQVYYFYPMASTLVSKIVLGSPPAPVSQCVMVFPGSRARLLSFRLWRDPRLAELLEGWHLLKFRHLRGLAERPDLTAEVWEQLLDADPPFFEEAEQMRLL